MPDAGEEIVGLYLKEIKGCESIRIRVSHPDYDGDIDVIGIDRKNMIVYICEVVTHLPTGLLYVNRKTKKPDNVRKLVEKFRKDVDFAKQNYEGFEHVFMLWSPIAKTPSRHGKYDQIEDVNEVKAKLEDELGVELNLVINHEYARCLSALREYAASQSKELASPLLRFMQIEEWLKSHLERLDKILARRGN